MVALEQPIFFSTGQFLMFPHDSLRYILSAL